VISKMDVNGVPAKSKHILMCNEIIEACGRRQRISIVEARQALKTCLDTMELHIAKKPT
jgi:hypothetical protein